MPGTLFVVATPIGNLEDITLRALRVLREVDLIAAEDTRHSGKLLAHFGIATPTLSFHEHNTRSRIPKLISLLEAGKSIAVVTDAGTPGISDPGVELIRAAVDSGIRVDPIPGASASLAAAVASGFPLESLKILGFAPSRSKDRRAWLENLAHEPGVVTFFEAPHRIVDSLRDMRDILGNRQIMVARELTKMHQELLRGPANMVSDQIHTPARGEFTVVLGPDPAASVAEPATQQTSDAEVAAEFGQIIETAGRREAVAALARKFKRSSRDIYSAIERHKRASDQ